MATTVFYWPRSFVMRSSEFLQEFRDKPYQRLSATLIANPHTDFSLHTGGDTLSGRIALLSPGSRRHFMHIKGGDCFLFDVEITSSAYRRIKGHLPVDGSTQPPPATSEAILNRLAGLHGMQLEPDAAVGLFHDVIGLLVQDAPEPHPLDPRIELILQRVDQSARDEVTVAGLARSVKLSESRLRSLVQRELGCSLSRYLRWATAWKTAAYWRPGLSITEVAHAAGFHDLSHAHRTFVEIFGMSPSRVLRSGEIELIRCQT